MVNKKPLINEWFFVALKSAIIVPMQITKTHKIILSILVIAILFGGYVYFDRKSKDSVPVITNDSNQTATTTIPNTFTDSRGLTYTISPVSNKTTSTLPTPIPDLNRPVTKSIGANVTEANTSTAEVKVKELQTALKVDPKGFANWIELGMYQQLGGDYDGAIISWKYASRLVPADSVSLGNIGNLYAYNLKDTTQAEVYYKQAIARAPQQGYLYYQLAQIYLDFSNDKVKAMAIIDQGLSQNQNDGVLLDFKARLN